MIRHSLVFITSISLAFGIAGGAMGQAAAKDKGKSKTTKKPASTSNTKEKAKPAAPPPATPGITAPAATDTGSASNIGLPDQAKTGALPPLTSGLSDRAALAFGKRDWTTARKCYLEMLELEPNNALTLANLGAVEQQAKNLKVAQGYFQKALAINPSLQQTWVALGLACYESGDHYQALSALSRAVHEDPTDARSHNYLAVAAKSLGWLDAAEGELQRAIELNPDYANAHFNLALMYLERKPPAVELGRRHYQKALNLGSAKDELIEEKLKAQP